MERTDIIILGGGLVGLTLAIALDAHGVSSAVIDPADPADLIAQGFDGRVSAVASASGKMLDAIGVGARLAGKGCPIDAIEVGEGARGVLGFRPDPDDGALGVMVENRELRIALHATAEAAKDLHLFPRSRAAKVERDSAGVRVTLEDGRTLAGALLVAAEGRNSPTREAAGITVARWQYDHVAVITTIAHEKPHGNTAFELFFPAGPFAMLPMNPDAEGRSRSALVWTVSRKDAAGLVGLSDRGFLAEAEKRMGAILGRLLAATPRSSYPLGFHHAARITGERLALVGDAAHGIHPIAGQGLNLGFRDAAALAEVLVDGVRLGLDPGDAQLLARYETWRSLDTATVAITTDALTHVFGVPGRTASTIRRLGMSMIDRIGPLRDRFMAEARGESGALPKLLQGITV